MTDQPPTELAKWITSYYNRTNNNIAQSLHDMAKDLGLHDCQESAEGAVRGIDSESSNPARVGRPAGVSTSCTHGAAKPEDSTIAGCASDAETGGVA